MSLVLEKRIIGFKGFAAAAGQNMSTSESVFAFLFISLNYWSLKKGLLCTLEEAEMPSDFSVYFIFIFQVFPAF